MTIQGDFSAVQVKVIRKQSRLEYIYNIFGKERERWKHTMTKEDFSPSQTETKYK